MTRTAQFSQANESTVLAPVMRQCRRGFLTVALFSFVINALMLAGPLYMIQVYDRVLTSGSVETLILLTVILLLAILALVTLEVLRTALTVRIGSWLTRALGPAYLDIGLRARLDGDGRGSQAFRDIAQVQSFVATQGMTAFFDFPWTPLFLAVIWLLHPWLGVFAVVVTLILLVLSVANEAVTRTALGRANTQQILSHRLAESTLENADTVGAMGMGGTLAGQWSARNLETQAALLAASRASGYTTGAAKFIRIFAQSAILGLGAFFVLGGEMSPGVMIASSVLLSRALAPVDMALTAWKNFAATRSAYRRLGTLAEAYPPVARKTMLPPPEGGLSVQGLSSRGGNGAVLNRVSFDVPKGQVVAVIGPSAAGKSTLCRHLVRLAEPAAGAIRIGGIDIARWNPEELGAHIGFLGQDMGLFAGTVRENIARMALAEDHTVIEAARLAHAHEMIAQLPDGYDTVIGDRGAGLSAGQRQRIGLARAVFGEPSLIVLDEPNANLDQAGEAALAATVIELKERGATIVIVGHRPSTIAQSDWVLLMKAGRVQGFGPRAEMLRKIREVRDAKAIESGKDAEPDDTKQAAKAALPEPADQGPATPRLRAPSEPARRDAETANAEHRLPVLTANRTVNAPPRRSADLAATSAPSDAAAGGQS